MAGSVKENNLPENLQCSVAAATKNPQNQEQERLPMAPKVSSNNRLFK